MEETNNSVYLVEHIVEYEFTIISDQEPRIGDLNIVGLFEGKMFNFEVELSVVKEFLRLETSPRL